MVTSDTYTLSMPGVLSACHQSRDSFRKRFRDWQWGVWRFVMSILILIVLEEVSKSR